MVASSSSAKFVVQRMTAIAARLCTTYSISAKTPSVTATVPGAGAAHIRDPLHDARVGLQVGRAQDLHQRDQHDQRERLIARKATPAIASRSRVFVAGSSVCSSR